MPTAPRILILYAHSASHLSRTNRRLMEAAATVPNVLVHDLYEIYPDFHIDIAQEQSLLSNADLIVFQHPIQWYSMPALLKEWVDVVLEHGWAYGPEGHALHGKDFWLVATTGGTDEAYRESGHHRQRFSAFLPPFQQTVHLCGMRWLPPHILHGAPQADDAAVAAHCEQYRKRLATYPHWPELDAHHESRRHSTDLIPRHTD
jgi:putative NADPH-quinone reductase